MHKYIESSLHPKKPSLISYDVEYHLQPILIIIKKKINPFE